MKSKKSRQVLVASIKGGKETKFREIKKRAFKLRLFLRPLRTELEFCSVISKESGNPENPEKNLPEQGK